MSVVGLPGVQALYVEHSRAAGGCDRRGFTEVSDMYEANFRRRLMSMGLRISGAKAKA